MTVQVCSSRSVGRVGKGYPLSSLSRLHKGNHKLVTSNQVVLAGAHTLRLQNVSCNSSLSFELLPAAQSKATSDPQLASASKNTSSNPQIVEVDTLTKALNGCPSTKELSQLVDQRGSSFQGQHLLAAIGRLVDFCGSQRAQAGKSVNRPVILLAQKLFKLWTPERLAQAKIEQISQSVKLAALLSALEPACYQPMFNAILEADGQKLEGAGLLELHDVVTAAARLRPQGMSQLLDLCASRACVHYGTGQYMKDEEPAYAWWQLARVYADIKHYNPMLCLVICNAMLTYADGEVDNRLISDVLCSMAELGFYDARFCDAALDIFAARIGKGDEEYSTSKHCSNLMFAAACMSHARPSLHTAIKAIDNYASKIGEKGKSFWDVNDLCKAVWSLASLGLLSKHFGFAEKLVAALAELHELGLCTRITDMSLVQLAQVQPLLVQQGLSSIQSELLQQGEQCQLREVMLLSQEFAQQHSVVVSRVMSVAGKDNQIREVSASLSAQGLFVPLLLTLNSGARVAVMFNQLKKRKALSSARELLSCTGVSTQLLLKTVGSAGRVIWLDSQQWDCIASKLTPSTYPAQPTTAISNSPGSMGTENGYMCVPSADAQNGQHSNQEHLVLACLGISDMTVNAAIEQLEESQRLQQQAMLLVT